MKRALASAAIVGLVAGGVAAQNPTPPTKPDAPGAPKPVPTAEKPAAEQVPADPNAAAFVAMLVKSVGNKDPRIRFAVREALVTMGHQSTPALSAAHAATTDKHVQAFIQRTLKRVKQMAKRSNRGPGQFFSMMTGRDGRDIDRIAMDLRLTWDEMDKIVPIFESYDKNAKALMTEMKDAGAFGDPGAWQDLNDEMKAMVDDVAPELVTLLGEKRGTRAKRYLRRGGMGGLPMMLGDIAGGSFEFEGGAGTVRIIRPGGDPDK